MDSWITKDNNSFPIVPYHPAVVSASDVHHKRISVSVAKKHAKNLLEHARKAKEQRREKRKKKLEELTERINKITTSDYPNNQKIESLQRLLNNHYKDMDDAMIARVRRDLAELNQKPNIAEKMQQEAEQNKGDSSSPGIKFVNPMNAPTVIGHDNQTHEKIMSDGTRQPEESDNNNNDSEENEDEKLPLEVQIAKSVIERTR